MHYSQLNNAFIIEIIFLKEVVSKVDWLNLTIIKEAEIVIHDSPL